MKPQHKRKHDRITYSGASKEEIMADHAALPFDRAAREANAKWGINRLPELVPPEMALKFGGAVAHLNQAISDGKPEEAAAAAHNAMRGLAAMDLIATEAGHRPALPEAWQLEVDGKPACIVRDMALWPAVEAATPGLRIYSLSEVALALAHYGGMVSAVKAAWPGAQIVPRVSGDDGDIDGEIPW